MNKVKKTLVSVETLRVVYKEREINGVKTTAKLYKLNGDLIPNQQMLAIHQKIADALAVGDKDKIPAERYLRDCEDAYVGATSVADKLAAAAAKREALAALLDVHSAALIAAGIDHLVEHKRYFEEGEELFDIISGEPIIGPDGDVIVSRGGNHFAITLPE